MKPYKEKSKIISGPYSNGSLTSKLPSSENEPKINNFLNPVSTSLLLLKHLLCLISSTQLKLTGNRRILCIFPNHCLFRNL